MFLLSLFFISYYFTAVFRLFENFIVNKNRTHKHIENMICHKGGIKDYVNMQT